MSSLALLQKPDLTDPRVLKRALKVLDLAYDIQMLPKAVKRMGANEFYKVIGQPNRNPGTYFKHLFEHSAPYSKGGASFEYRTNRDRVDALAKELQVQKGLTAAAHRAGKSFKDPVPKRSDLPRTGDRVYPWWALMKRDLRLELFVQEHGVCYDYDLEAAKPTVTLQVWNTLMHEKKPILMKHSDACKLPAWTALVSNRSEFREKFSREAGITLAQAKWVCQSVLNGGVASPLNQSYLDELGRDATMRVQDAPMYQALRADFQVFWKHLKELGIEFQGARSAGEVLSRLYNQIEDQIMNVIENEIQTPIWYVHDGFMSATEIDVPALERAIAEKTKFSVKLEMTKISREQTGVSEIK